MPTTPQPDLAEHEEEANPFDDVLQKLLSAKPDPKKAKPPHSAVEPIESEKMAKKPKQSKKAEPAKMDDRFEISVSNDRKEATLKMLEGSGMQGAVTHSFEDICRLIEVLGQVRAVMDTMPPPKLNDGTRVKAVIDPRW